jgi:hypothetical protein
MDSALQQALTVQAGLSLLSLWPAQRLLNRAALPRWWAALLLLPLLGWPIFGGLVGLRPWPALPSRPVKLHPRQTLRQEGDPELLARRRAAGLEDV